LTTFTTASVCATVTTALSCAAAANAKPRRETAVADAKIFLMFNSLKNK